jgi:hypothetical protein
MAAGRDGSASPGDMASSSHYTQRGGYMGQLNNAPTISSVTFSRGTNSLLRVPLSPIIASAIDPEGDTIHFYAYDPTTEENGSAALLGNQFLQYSAPSDYNGNDTIFWTALDSEGDQAQGSILLRLAMPTDGPTLNLISRNVSGDGATLLFAGLPPATEEVQVHLQYTDTLTPVNWQDLGGNVVTNGILTIYDPTGGTNITRFYRTVYPSAQ